MDKISMWITRNGVDNALLLWPTKPVRHNDRSKMVWEFMQTFCKSKTPPDWIHYDVKCWTLDPKYDDICPKDIQKCVMLDPTLFPNITWESEPYEVVLSGLEIDEKALAQTVREEALAAKFCGFISEGETPGLTDFNIFEYAYKLGVLNTLGIWKTRPKDLLSVKEWEEKYEKKEPDESKEMSPYTE